MFVLMIFFGLLFFCFSFYQSKYSARWDRVIMDVIFGFFCHGIIVSKIPQVLLFITIELLIIVIISIQIKKDDTWVDGLYIVEQYRKWKREREKRYITIVVEGIVTKNSDDNSFSFFFLSGILLQTM